MITARTTWHSISDAQRRTLIIVGTGSRKLRRSSWSKNFYDAYGEPHAVDKAAGLLTVRNLCSRGLLAWDGGSFDPEKAAVITERGLFVLRHGRATKKPAADDRPAE